MFTQDFVLRKVEVTGEISNLKYHQSGHIYFTLKDDDACISAACFKYSAMRLRFRLEDGMKVIVTGQVDVYEKGGNYTLKADTIKKSEDLAGELHLRYEALKKELEERGMFDSGYKQPVPKYVKKLGVVTAPTGAAIQDIINITQRRNPFVRIILYPAIVQGDGAAGSICAGIKALEAYGVDAMIVGRGGGSIEDLWAFNEEIVAQAIFDSTVPVISAVGHETDFTIADFVADLRAPTPSAAAEIAVCELAQIQSEIEGYRRRLKDAANRQIYMYRSRIEKYELRLKTVSPSGQLLQKRSRCVALEEHLEGAMRSLIERKRHALQMYISAMKGLSPLEKLSRGYLVGINPGGKRITGIGDVSEGDMISLYVSDGQISAMVSGVSGKDHDGQ